MKHNFQPTDLTVFLTGMIDQESQQYKQTGRTTELAKAYINWSLQNIGKDIKVRDHHLNTHTTNNSSRADENLINTIALLWQNCAESDVYEIICDSKEARNGGFFKIRMERRDDVLKNNYIDLIKKLGGLFR